MPSSTSHPVDTIPDLLIPMRDGVSLAATLYRPSGGGRRPCLVNYNPYHKDGRVGLWYEPLHRFFAGRGYAALVIDFRGLGCSEGINNVPFDAQEGRDGHDAVEWAAAQPWCDGNVGMWGSSYGGITALKTAAQRPPHLRAIVPVHATTDNFLDFLLVGGCRNGFWPNGDWGPRMVGCNLTPPLSADPDGRLARLWAERLEQSRPWCLDWYDPADETARWAARAIPVERVTAATLAVCGWKDFYVQGTLDYFQRLVAPKKLLMGPWKHVFPNLSVVEPVNLLEMMVCWWERWLHGESNGAETGPPITLFVQGSGVWRHEDAWPPQRNEPRELFLLPGRLLGDRPPVQAGAGETYPYDPTVGLDSIGFDPWTAAVIDPGDHNGDDTRSLCFTSEPLPEDWELTGQGQAVLNVRASVPGFQYTAKLCDVHPDGRSRLVTMGWNPDPAEQAGQVHEVTVPLRATSHVFRRGHRLRLGIALADFPRLWPTPHLGEIRLEYDPQRPPRLLLPRTPPQHPALTAPEFPPPGPELRSPLELEVAQSWSVGRELVRQIATLVSHGRHQYQLRNGGIITCIHEYAATVAATDPAGAAIEVRSDVEVRRPAGVVLVKTTSTFTPRIVSIHVEIEQDGAVTFRRDWKGERPP
jgi:putative CocE/NonD family hydrolase